MKDLILINGPMGVGKTAVCTRLYRRLPDAVWLDGDWCWMMHPFRVNDENKAMVEDNIAHLLQNFLRNTGLRYIVFAWVMHQESIVQNLLARVGTEHPYRLHRISLVCSPEVLRQRLLGRGTGDVIENAVARLPLYRQQPSHCLDTSEMTLDQVVERIRELVCAEGK